MRQSIQQVRQYFLLFMLVSFLGWVAETLFFFLCFGRYCDRGFLTLPFCTIYGCAFLLLYGLIGVPGRRDTGLLRTWTARHPPVLYALIAALVTTLLELVTGLAFDRALALRLWDYSAYPLHFRGYICLEYTLLWGLLLPPCMKYLFLPLKSWVFSLPAAWLRPLAGSLGLLTLLDWGVNLSRQVPLFP